MIASPDTRARGQPIIALLAIPVAWTLFRMATHAPELFAEPVSMTTPRPIADSHGQRQQALVRPLQRTGGAGLPRQISSGQEATGDFAIHAPRSRQEAPKRIGERSPSVAPSGKSNVDGQSPAPAGAPSIEGAAGGNTTLAARPDRPSPWSADGWIVLREGGSTLGTAGAAAPVYGASQAGAVVRYRLAAASFAQPAAFVRAVQALGGARETDLAAGLSARLVPGAALMAHVEARVSHRANRTDIRPAAFLTGGIDDAPLPLGFSMRGYAQGGYVGGRDATAFADGSLVAERKLGQGKTAVSLGAGLWGGAQRGASRLDFGPSAILRFPIAEGSGRLAVDYRIRAAGNAAPASGPALTLTAGL